MAARSPADVAGRWLRMVGAQEAELVAAVALENDSERAGIRTAAALTAAGLDLVDAILDAMVHEHAPAGGSDVRYQLTLSP